MGTYIWFSKSWKIWQFFYKVPETHLRRPRTSSYLMIWLYNSFLRISVVKSAQITIKKPKFWGLVTLLQILKYMKSYVFWQYLPSYEFWIWCIASNKGNLYLDARLGYPKAWSRGLGTFYWVLMCLQAI